MSTVIEERRIHNEAAFDLIKSKKDENIGFNPNLVLKNREELKINLLYFDEEITKSKDSYNYYKQFKVNVLGGFYACDDKEFYKKYLDEINKIQPKIPPYVVVTYPNYFERIYNISKGYNFVKEIIIISRIKKKYEKYLKSHKKLLKFIAKDYEELIKYLKSLGENKGINFILDLFLKKKKFTSEDIQMNRQLCICPIITSYEYDQLYFLFHRAIAHFFTNDSNNKNPKDEEYPKFDQENYDKIKEYIFKSEMREQDRDILLNHFRELKLSKNFLEDAVYKYTLQSPFCYFINGALRNFDESLINVAYYIGPLLFGLIKYAIDHPELSINKDITLHRIIKLNPLDLYNYELAVGHIICFPSLTSTSIYNSFIPTPIYQSTNNENEDILRIEMIIKYKHKNGNIPPGIDIKGLSEIPNENERLLFPFTFFWLNKIEKIDNKNFIFEMEIINRKRYIEYDLQEGNRFNIEDLEENGNLHTTDIEESTKIDFINNNKGNCIIF